ncbi:AMP-dependent synthetase/ligase [Dactylosporangium sp. CA-233914]|uniref:AMP-dependent synthetase/ligase n=1 Tax=Dactylosporangium sp. CA-233914 TaxID=3239934 RepID=UPI003D8FA3F9
MISPDTACTAPPDETAAFERLWRAAPPSLGALLQARVAATPDAEAYRRPDGHGGWRSQTWAGTHRAATEIAAGLLGLGLAPEDRVAIMSGTRVEWIEADLGIMCAGGATTTVYPTSTLDDVVHILADSASRIAIVERAEHLAKVRAPGSPVEHAIVIEDGSLDALRERGRALLAERPDAVERALAGVGPEHLATLIYTSGTTGRPKGVQLPHRSWLYEAIASQATGLATPDDLGYFWLPLSHSFGKTLLASQVAIGHAAAVDGDVTRIITNLPVVRPTIMPAVPRIFEKVHAGVLAAVHRDGGLRRRMFDWAVTLGRARSATPHPGVGLRAAHAVADRIVLGKVRARFGGRMRYLISGAAKLAPDLAAWFDAVGLPVLEGYGLTESSAATLVNRLTHLEYGTVGLPLPGTAVAIAPDGEILVRGPGVMPGYHGHAGAEALEDGWLHTGDVGEITDRGSLRITDRKKDLIKTSGGKYVAPQVLEARLKALCPLAGNVVVHGEGRKHITALIDLDPDAARAWAAEHGLASLALPELATAPELLSEVERYVAHLNAGLGPWETVKRFAVLPRHLSVEDGDLTPSLKLRRRVVEDRYRPLLDGLYDQP